MHLEISCAKFLPFCSGLGVLIKLNCYHERIVAAVLPLISLLQQNLNYISVAFSMQLTSAHIYIYIYMCVCVCTFTVGGFWMPFVVTQKQYITQLGLNNMTLIIILVIRSWLKWWTTHVYIFLQHANLVKLLLLTTVWWMLPVASPSCDFFIAINLKHGEVIT